MSQQAQPVARTDVATTDRQADQPPWAQRLPDFRLVIGRARQQASNAVNAAQIVAIVSLQWVQKFGRGFTEKNPSRTIQLAEAYQDEPIVLAPLRPLSWSRFLALLPLDKPCQRDFYPEMCRIEGWSVRTQHERIDYMLYERTVQEISVIENGKSDPEHCSVDVTAFDRKPLEKGSTLLRARAERRGWLYGEAVA